MAKKPPATKASTFTYGLGNPARTDVIKPSTYKPPQPKNKSSGSSRSSLDKKIDAKFQGVKDTYSEITKLLDSLNTGDIASSGGGPVVNPG
jgi:hypothetical protein